MKKIKSNENSKLIVQDKDLEKLNEYLEKLDKLRDKAIIHFLLSTGCCLKTIPHLKIRNVKSFQRHDFIIFNEGKSNEYLGILTPGTAKVLNDYLEFRKEKNQYLKDEAPLFVKNNNAGLEINQPIQKRRIQLILKNIPVKNYDNITKFRKNFKLKLKNDNIPSHIINLLLGTEVNLEMGQSDRVKRFFKIADYKIIQKIISSLSLNYSKDKFYEKGKGNTVKNKLRCFVIMPIGTINSNNWTMFREIYCDIIKDAVQEANFQCIRADEIES